MSSWLEAYEKLPEAQKARVQRWIHLQKFIAETLRVPFDTWIEKYVGAAMNAPFDYSFMQVTVPGFSGLETEGASFSTALDPATARTARVPLKAKNQMGRLSPALQEALAALLEAPSEDKASVPPADVVTLQKIFPSAKPLAKLKRKDFRNVRIRREGNDIVIAVEAEVLLQQDVFELSAALNRPQF